MWKTIYPRRRKENNSNEEEGAKEELTTKIRIRSWRRRRKKYWECGGVGDGSGGDGGGKVNKSSMKGDQEGTGKSQKFYQ